MTEQTKKTPCPASRPMVQMERLIDVMARLRDPETGCPWDVEQDFRSLLPCLLEEVYEVVEAVENDDAPHLCEELGDVLLQVVFYAQIAAEKGLFDIEVVARREADKMIERHPHVFGDRMGVETADDVMRNWEADKAKKRSEAAQNGEATPSLTEAVTLPSALDGVNTALPAVARAFKLQKRAARVGFDWTDPRDIFAKIREEADELQVELDKNTDRTAIEVELGDLFFVLINLARRLDIEPETALRATNRKFEQRFRGMEALFHQQNRSFPEASLEEKEAAWQEVKRRLRA